MQSLILLFYPLSWLSYSLHLEARSLTKLTTLRLSLGYLFPSLVISFRDSPVFLLCTEPWRLLSIKWVIDQFSVLEKDDSMCSHMSARVKLPPLVGAKVFQPFQIQTRMSSNLSGRGKWETEFPWKSQQQVHLFNWTFSIVLLKITKRSSRRSKASWFFSFFFLSSLELPKVQFSSCPSLCPSRNASRSDLWRLVPTAAECSRLSL